MPKAAGKSMSKRRVVAKARAHVPKKKNNVLRSGQIRSIAGKGSKLKRKQNHRVGLARADGPLDFYAVVRVGRGGDVPTDAEGRLGVVVGRAE